ncbi:CPBP family intramembrane glutamic endopeptidase [Fonticella tunisiensis]|uniref:CAAX prenyl protease 2/Lysostaphin resistance protein A-like domain-containing protein n=1 Tax=Fonticella tunisiensis TaxID=1096341 RepID=A0A4R7KQL8_9CLOT|nr:type II CAAX endopeptidase family protein [Fonticella tunisiensis]TDT58454.1 hypothetical protein EDD71_111105 [Fonticella tunisiensis]
MMRIFINKNGKLRSGWKIWIVLMASIFAAFVLNYVISFLSLSLMVSWSKFKALSISEDYAIQIVLRSPVRNYMLGLAGNLSIIAAVAVALKLIDRGKFRDIGVIFSRKSFKELIFGLLLGILSMSVIFFILLKIDNISLSHPQFNYYMLYGLITFIFVGIAEEMFSRGYCIMVLRQTQIKWAPVAGSSIIFTLLHLGNPNLKILGLINIFLTGILFALMYIKTESIFMSAGFHITWNYFQGNIFGFPVSGVDSKGFYGVKILKDNLLTGGSFGPEAGILTTSVLLLIMLAVWKFGTIMKKKEISNKISITAP